MSIVRNSYTDLKAKPKEKKKQSFLRFFGLLDPASSSSSIPTHVCDGDICTLNAQPSARYMDYQSESDHDDISCSSSKVYSK